MTFDIVTYEIIRSSLYAIAREMKTAMMRTAGSPMMHASGDSSAAIFDPDMQLAWRRRMQQAGASTPEPGLNPVFGG